MNAQELRNLQAPLKARYKEDPAAAHILTRATCVLFQTLSNPPPVDISMQRTAA